MNKYKNNFNFFGNIQSFNEDIFPNNDLIRIYKNNHIYACLSRVEAFPMTLLEALACELPVLSFNTEGGNELVVNDWNGKLVNEFSENEMAKCIMSYQRSNIYEIHKKNTLNSVSKYDLENVAKKILEKYQTIS